MKKTKSIWLLALILLSLLPSGRDASLFAQEVNRPINDLDVFSYLPFMTRSGISEDFPCLFLPATLDNPEGVDLIINLFTLDPISNIRVGEPVNLEIHIHNQGQTDIPLGNNFFVDFYDMQAAPPEIGQVGDVSWGVQGDELLAGATLILHKEYTFVEVGRHLVWLQVDTDNNVTEEIETNNMYGCLAIRVNG